MVKADEIQGNINNLTKEEKESIDVVLKDYGNMIPFELSSLTHSETPWRSARSNLPADSPSHAIISLESMGEYYGSLI